MLIEIYSKPRVSLIHSKPCLIPSPAIFRIGGISLHISWCASQLESWKAIGFREAQRRLKWLSLKNMLQTVQRSHPDELWQ